VRCEQPGCTGTIVDGYCDVCGMPPSELATVATAAPRPAAKAPRRAGDGGGCGWSGASKARRDRFPGRDAAA
jgi:serine/threonine-protein kinase PknG